MRKAFTLIELMISIALVVILMYGITKVFSMTSQTANRTQAISSGLRDGRAAQAVFYQDLSTEVGDSPWILLNSHSVAAFNSSADEKSDRDGDPTTLDLDGDNVEGSSASPPTLHGEYQSGTTVNYRNHRVDVFSFFSRQRFPRQTGDTQLMAEQSAGEAMVWYGHVAMPNNSGATFFTPGAPDTVVRNDNNRYAEQFTLGRVAMLLRTPDAAGKIIDRKGLPRQYFIRSATPNTLTPLEDITKATDYSGSGPVVRDSRYDLAGTSIDDFRQILKAWLADPINIPDSQFAPAAKNWFGRMMVGEPFGQRYRANPFITQPITPQVFAGQMPIFLQKCSQFIVEFAGDYLEQDTNQGTAAAPNPNYGKITGSLATGKTDGQVDFLVSNVGGNISRSIRWYGFPRETTGDLAITATSGDVVPVRDVIGAVAPFEHFAAGGKNMLPVMADYAALPQDSTHDSNYLCAWGPEILPEQRPKMIRITIALKNSDSISDDGQVFQWVFTLP